MFHADALADLDPPQQQQQQLDSVAAAPQPGICDTATTQRQVTAHAPAERLAAGCASRQQLLQLYQQYQQHRVGMSSGGQTLSAPRSLGPQAATTASATAIPFNGKVTGSAQPGQQAIARAPAPLSPAVNADTWSAAQTRTQPPADSSAPAASHHLEEDLSHLYNSPSVAEARRQAGLPAYVPPDDTSWVQLLPRPPAPKPAGGKRK